MKNDNYLHTDLTQKIIRCYYNVYNTLGYGFLEKVYENALFVELKNLNFYVEKQKQINVFYQEIEVGNYFADLMVNESVIIEIKAAEKLAIEHEYQLINYLKATEIEVGLLLNFGKEPEFKRKVFTNDRVKSS